MLYVKDIMNICAKDLFSAGDMFCIEIMEA